MRVPTIKNRPPESPLQLSLAETSLSLRTVNILESGGVFTVGDLLHRRREDLLKLDNFGDKTLNEVFRVLQTLGFKAAAA